MTENSETNVKVEEIVDRCTKCGHTNVKKCDECLDLTCKDCWCPDYESMFPNSGLCVCLDCKEKIKKFLDKLDKRLIFTNCDNKEHFVKYVVENKEEPEKSGYCLVPVQDFVRAALKMNKYKNGVPKELSTIDTNNSNSQHDSDHQ